MALLSRPAVAQAGELRVALVDPGPALESAARAALAPWNVVLVVVPGPSPGATAPEANAAARALAQAEGASALVWISDHDGRHALWVYDLESDQVVERELVSEPPFDDAAAAAVALSVKSLLRHGATAPPDERYGSTGAQAGLNPGLRSQTPSFSAWIAPSPPPAVRGPGASQTPGADSSGPAPPANARSVLDLVLGAGLRANFTRPRAVEPRLRLGATWWPQGGRLGFGASAAAGPGVAVEDPRFDGHLVDATLALTLDVRRDITRAMRMSAAFGGSAHLLVLDGSLPQERRSLSDLRLSPSIDLRQQTDWGLGSHVRIGLFAELSYLLRAERYLVGARSVLGVSHFAASLGLALDVALLGAAR